MKPNGWLVRTMEDPRVGAVASKALARLKNLVAPALSFGVLHFVRWDLRTSASRPVPPGFESRELRADELAGAAASFARSPGSFHRRARLGDRCFGSFRDGRLVNVRWCALRPIEIPELDLFACPGPDEAYFYAAMTLPQARGLGAAAATRHALETALVAEGRTVGHAYVQVDNFASSSTRHDFHETYQIAYLRLRGGKVHFSGGYRPPVYCEADIPAPVSAELPRHAAGA